MNKRIKKLWTAALRSGKYRQGRGRLRSIEPDGPKDCCLGVLCDIYIAEHPTTAEWDPEWDHEGHIVIYTDNRMDVLGSDELVLPEPVMGWAEVDQPSPQLGEYSAADHNDGKKSAEPRATPILAPATFAQIADLIDKHL